MRSNLSVFFVCPKTSSVFHPGTYIYKHSSLRAGNSYDRIPNISPFGGNEGGAPSHPNQGKKTHEVKQ